MGGYTFVRLFVCLKEDDAKDVWALLTHDRICIVAG
jgi:hypothetical protein